MFSRVVAFICVLVFSANVSAAISFISSVSDKGNDEKAALVVPAVTVGDVLLVQVAIRDRSGSDGVTAPAGWTQIGSQIADGSVLQSLYYRVATAGDVGVSYEWDFDQSGNRRYILGMSVFRGVDTANPIGSESSQIGMSGTAVTAPSVVTAGANSMLVGLYTLEAGNQSFTPASGMLEAYDVEEHNNNGITAMAAYAVQASAGATGDKVAIASKSNDDAIGHLVALNEGATLPSVSTVGGSCGTDNLIVVQYASTVSDDALNVSNYTLTSGNITGITRQDGSTVVLATDGLMGGQAYTLSVQGIANTVSFDGLMGHYYDQRNSSGSKVGYPGGEFTGQQFLRLDSQVNFSWNTATPTVFPNVSGNDERFSIRWTGYISPTTAGNYEFRLYSDDGARLSLDGTQIVNDWSLHSPRYSSVSASQALSVGQTYEVQMEHFEQTGQAFAQLEWRRDGGSWENIPTANLTTCAIPATPPLPPSVLEFRMDETSWNGTTGEVIDSSGNNNNATAINSLTTTNAGHLCRAGDFDGVNDYIETNDIYTSLSGTSSMSFWIKTTQTGDDIGWRAPGVTGIEQAGGSDDIFWGWLDASGRIGLSVANDFTTKSTQRVNDNAYHHVVLTRDAATGAYKIYIDGVLDKSGTLATGIIGNSFSSIGRIEDTGGTPEYFEGSLDELKIFDSVLSDTDVTTLFNETRVCPPTSCTLGSFAITQPAYGLACPNARAPINIKAMCDDGVTVKDDYAGTIDLLSNQNSQSEFYLASSGGSSITDIALTGSENGEVDVYLFHKNEYPSLKVTAEDTSLSVSTEATNGTDFRTFGFRVDRPVNFDFVCGNSKAFTITAIGQDTSLGGACNTLTGFDGTKSLKAWADVNIDPLTLGVKNTGLPKRILLNGSAVAVTKPSSSNMTVDFSAGIATISVEYEDVGEVIDVNVEHDDFPYDGTVSEITSTLTGALGSFIVSPEKVIIEVDSADAACASNLATCSKFVRANEPFAMTSKALCIGTPELVAKSYRGTVALTSDLKAPSGGTPAAPAVNEIIFDGAPSGGEEKISDQQIGEVGVFTITATPPAYFGVPVAVASVESANIGRFYPASFDVSMTSADFNLSCNSSFTYMGQPFGYLTPPEVTIKALSYTGDLTQNYEGDFWKLGTSLNQGSSCTGADSGFCYTDNVAGAALFSAPTASQSYGSILNANGLITLTMHPLLSDEFNYQRPISGALVSPFDADVRLNIKLIDSDDVEGGAELANIGFSGDPDAATAGAPMNTTVNEYLKYGRWVLENAFGPETNPLKIPMSAEFYDGTRFVVNTADNCTTFNAPDMRVTPSLNNSGTTSASGSGVAVSGLAALSDQISLSAPGDGKDGFAELCIDVQNWLKFDWNGDGLDESQVCDTSASPTMGDNDNPMSTATFGRYRGHDRIIYWRELSN
ncbi:DUF6701 domain-containing protein [Alkalimarinus alittae]|uniref:PA14 domain-containing protein n=1 Tax=Alkalimarinus alittae TaxID=2961619 RepID=A0ABY6N7R4_9ALTE|nr:DUF6701 domain-containing protein [Alkalimarinus alittae]UZE98080.1 PA14 domain-containing protein [Alkalimarinus alittae]